MVKAIIIEDEELLANNLELALKEVDPEINIITKLDSVAGAVKWLSINNPDLIFLDIQLSDGLSFKIFENIQIDVPIIFLTAYDQYAVRAFKLNSIDYLLKPLNIVELKNAIVKFKKHSTQKQNYSDIREILQKLGSNTVEYKKRFLVYIGERIKYIETSEIAYFFILGGETFMRDFNGSTYPCDYSLDKLQPELNPAIFFRVNRQYTVSINSIKQMYSMSKSAIKLELLPKPDGDIFVSLSRNSEFKRWLNQ